MALRLALSSGGQVVRDALLPGWRLPGPFSHRSHGSAGLDAAQLLPCRNPFAFTGFFSTSSIQEQVI